MPSVRLAEMAAWHEAEAAKTRAQTADSSSGGGRNECACPDPLQPGPGTCGWCLRRARLVADFELAHPTIYRQKTPA